MVDKAAIAIACSFCFLYTYASFDDALLHTDDASVRNQINQDPEVRQCEKEAILCIISYCVQSLFSSQGSSSTATRQVVEMFT